jgi:diguanylate cyclase (GGDEF)-like protein/PAS domain S-box-containing protein
MKIRSDKTVLLIENDPEETRSIGEMFKNQCLYAFRLAHVESLADFKTYLAEHSVDVVLLDLGLPDTEGQEAVRYVRAAAPRVSIVLLVGKESESTAMLAMKEGAQDYLVKGQIETRELMRALRNAVERKIIEEVLFVEKERAKVTLDSIGDAVICTDVLGKISFLNPVAERMTGWSLREAVGHPLTDSFRIMDATTGEVASNPMVAAIGQNRPAQLPVNCILTRRDGHEIFIEDSVGPIFDREGVASGYVLVFRDVTAARALAAQIAHLAEHDLLTSLPNRLLLNDRLGQAIAQAHRRNGMIALLFLDLDNFKHINDSLGHSIGDKLLQSVACRLQDCVRSPDTVSRQGGDEFLVLLQDVQKPEDAAIAARRILAAVAETHSVGEHDLHLTASIGLSIYPDDGLNAEALIKNSDTAMYQAKESGRNRYKFFTAEMNLRAVERQSIEEDLRRALKRREFTLHYQPKISLKTGATTGVEALIRWEHPTRGPIPPLQFISVAEDSGLILPIGAWVMREACRQCKAWADSGLPKTKVAVNVSAVQFQNGGFLEGIFAILEETGLDPKFLELEVTESVLMKYAGLAHSILKILRDRGVRVSVDDFGTGYSSLNYLRKFPLDALKIDQSFVHQISNNLDDAAIVTAIINIGRTLRLETIAEGVETPEELAFLKAQGCDEGQGYLFSRPVPPDQVAKLLAADGHQPVAQVS